MLLTLTYAHLPADVQFGVFAPALALFAPDINVGSKFFERNKGVKPSTFSLEVRRSIAELIPHRRQYQEFLH